MKKKNGFTLIELLAIIVILAIIAVITVPIILDIIDNSKKGAASDSAYGYKDAVNKWYIQELSTNHSFMMNNQYTVDDGKLVIDPEDENDEGIEIPLSGDKPSSGELHYSNNVFAGGCLVFGDYKVTFNSDGSVDETVKGDCSDYVFSAICPGPKCVYAYFNWLNRKIISGTPGATNEQVTLASNSYVSDYTDLSRNVFLGFILGSDSSIQKAYVCGIEQGDIFCLQGGVDESSLQNKEIYNYNLSVYPQPNGMGQTIHAVVEDNGTVITEDEILGSCYVIGNGENEAYCD